MTQYENIWELKRAAREGRLARFFQLKTREGVYEVRVNRIGVFSTLIERFPFDGEPEYREGVELFLSKIDVALLMQVIGFFREVCKRYGPLEAAAQIFWSTEGKKYYVYCPSQVVKRTGITLAWDNERCEKDVLVLEIHSHHIMRAFFSAEDDEFEKATRFYAVVGKIDRFFPEILLRYANARTYREVPPETLFEMSFPAKWLKNVEVPGNDQAALLQRV